MLKIMGIFLTAGAVQLFGIYKIWKIKYEKSQLKNTIYMLEYLKNIIINEKLILSEAFKKIISKSK